jgi:phosphatidylinositol glycan class Z
MVFLSLNITDSILGAVYGWPTYKTWEFTSSQPIRSVFPLWLVYGIPLTILKWLWEGLGYGEVPPTVAFYTLRLMMFLLSFVLQDWAVHELIPASRDRRVAITLIASSYVTWTFQTHTFSNSIETLVVLWCLVLINRIRDDKDHVQIGACIALAFLGVLGVFNRITFPAFLVVPSIQLVPHILHKPYRILILVVSGLVFLCYAVLIDTAYHAQTQWPLRVRDLPDLAIFTPYNNLKYNLDPSNLASHGLHPYYQHFVANLPQLLGPAILLLPFTSSFNSLFWTGITGVACLSAFQHQEARFLLPAVPILLASLRIPKRLARVWAAIWIVFNIFAGIVFGIYHQGGVVPMQTFLATHDGVDQVFWWKTYSPPRWLLNGKNDEVETIDLMGLDGDRMLARLNKYAACIDGNENSTVLVAPASATFLDPYLVPGSSSQKPELDFKELWRYKKHIGLDDLDFGDDGVWSTLGRVVGRRGLVAWEIRRAC